MNNEDANEEAEKSGFGGRKESAGFGGGAGKGWQHLKG